MVNPKSFTLFEKICRRKLNWAIKTFDMPHRPKKKKYPKFWQTKGATVGEPRHFCGVDPVDDVSKADITIQGTIIDISKSGERPKEFEELRKTDLPKLLAKYRINGIITPDQEKMLINQVSSVDRDDWYIAFLAIRGLKQMSR